MPVSTLFSLPDTYIYCKIANRNHTQLLGVSLSARCLWVTEIHLKAFSDFQVYCNYGLFRAAVWKQMQRTQLAVRDPSLLPPSYSSTPLLISVEFGINSKCNANMHIVGSLVSARLFYIIAKARMAWESEPILPTSPSRTAISGW